MTNAVRASLRPGAPMRTATGFCNLQLRDGDWRGSFNMGREKPSPLLKHNNQRLDRESKIGKLSKANAEAR